MPKRAMADLLAYLTAAEAPAKHFPGNEPAEIAADHGALTLPATRAALHGTQIVDLADDGFAEYAAQPSASNCMLSTLDGKTSHFYVM